MIKLRQMILPIGIATLVLASGLGTYVYQHKAKKTPSQAKDATTAIKQIVDEVGQIMVLPTDEQPTVGSVEDPEKLRAGPNGKFFALAEKGDKFLVYTKTGTAILYRPAIHKLIKVIPLQTVEVR
jgi:hypothetical protein